MKHSWKTYAVFVLGTEAVGGLSALFSRQGMALYNAAAAKPPLTPPPVAFPIAWSLLYLLMGIGAARIFLSRPSAARTRALKLYGLQLAFNFFWSILFFRFQMYGLAIWWLLALWVQILWMIRAFGVVERTAGKLQIPYLLWTTFALYLNIGVWWLNR